MLAIDTTVRILPTLDSARPYHGRFGTIAVIYDYPALGVMSFGVKLEGSQAVIDFSEMELEQVSTLSDALNGVDEAEATATTDKGVTVKVTYYASAEMARPFWIWMEQGLQVVNEEDVHLSFDFEEMGENLFSDYDLCAESTIWTRQPVAITTK